MRALSHPSDVEHNPAYHCGRALTPAEQLADEVAGRSEDDAMADKARGLSGTHGWVQMEQLILAREAHELCTIKRR